MISSSGQWSVDELPLGKTSERLPNEDGRDREKGCHPDLAELYRYILMPAPSPAPEQVAGPARVPDGPTGARREARKEA